MQWVLQDPILSIQTDFRMKITIPPFMISTLFSRMQCRICVSDQFYGWVCGFGGKVEVTSPAEVRQGLHDMVQKLAEQHN